MTDTLFLPLLVIGLLQVKHMICDGPLQTLRMVQDKSHYGRPQGLLHALIHVAGTALVLLLFGLPVVTVLWLGALELVVHYHIDYAKENIVKAMRWTHRDGPYWWAITTDQGLHHLSYVVFVWLAFRP
jgi:Protein of unknown function (DUF3307)